MPLELSAWLTPAILIAVAALLLRSNARLEERLGARIDETNRRIDEVNKNLSARIDEVNKSLSARIDEVNKSLSARIDEVNNRLGARIDDTNRRLDGIEGRLRAVEHGQARLEGLLEGLREAIAGRRPAA